MKYRILQDDYSTHPVEAMQPTRAVGHIEQILAVIHTEHQSGPVKAKFVRLLADEHTDMVNYCFRKLDVSPFGDDVRAEIEAERAAERARDAKG